MAISRSFDAMYHGKCSACFGRIVPGDSVHFEDDELVHDDCDFPEHVDDLPPSTEAPCPHCYTYHAGEC